MSPGLLVDPIDGDLVYQDTARQESAVPERQSEVDVDVDIDGARKEAREAVEQNAFEVKLTNKRVRLKRRAPASSPSSIPPWLVDNMASIDLGAEAAPAAAAGSEEGDKDNSEADERARKKARATVFAPRIVGGVRRPMVRKPIKIVRKPPGSQSSAAEKGDKPRDEQVKEEEEKKPGEQGSSL